MAKVLIGNFKGPKGDKGDKGETGTAATIQVGTTQTVQPEENAEVTNTGTTTAAVLNFKIPRGEDGMTDLTAEYKDASEYTCQPTVNAPAVVKELDGKTEQLETTGANILAYPYIYNSQTMHGVTFTVLDNGKVKTQGEATEDIVFILNSINYKAGETYYISGCPDGGSTSDYYFATGNLVAVDTGNGVVFSPQSDVFTRMNIYIKSGVNANNLTFEPMVCAGSTPLPWEPYTGGQPSPSPDYPQDITGVGGKAGGSDFSTEVEAQGRNLAEVTQTNKNQAYNGVTFKLNDDGSYTLNGTCAETSIFRLNQPNGADISNYPVICKLKVGTKYRITGSQIFIRNPTHPNGTDLNAMSNDIFYTPTEDTDVIGIRALITQGTTYSSTKTYYPGIWEDPDETRTEWAPFKRTSITIPLTSPLYEGDKICYVKPGESYVNSDGETVVADGVLYGCYRENVAVVFDGSEDESLGKNSGGDNLFSCTITNKAGSSVGGEQNLKCNKLTTAITNSNVSDMPDNSIKESGTIGSNVVFFNISEAGTTVESMRAWLSTNPLTVVYRLAQPYFEPFADQSIFYGLRTDDTLSYVYSSDPIGPNVTVEVAKNSTGGYLLESYATAQKNALAEADNASRLASVEQQLLTLNTTVSTMGGGQ